MSREAMKLALEALEWNYNTDLDNISACEQWAKMLKETITTLRAALAEPEQEPVAWAVYDILHGGSKTLHWPEQHSPNGDPKQYKAVPLYTAPIPRKPLTKEQIMSIDVLRYHFALNGGAGPISKKGKEIIGAIEQAHGIGEQHE